MLFCTVTQIISSHYNLFSSVALTKTVIAVIMVALLVILLSIALGFGFGLTDKSTTSTKFENLILSSTTPLPDDVTTSQKWILRGQDQPSELGNFSRAAVAVDGEPCAKIGM